MDLQVIYTHTLSLFQQTLVDAFIFSKLVLISNLYSVCRLRDIVLEQDSVCFIKVVLACFHCFYEGALGTLPLSTNPCRCIYFQQINAD